MRRCASVYRFGHRSKNRRQGSSRATAAVAAAAAIVFSRAPAPAVVSWNNSAGGSWAVAANWSPAAVPVAGDDVSIHTIYFSSITINFIGSYDAASALASLDLSSQRPSDLTLLQSGLSNPLYVGSETIGDSGGHATFTQTVDQQHTISGDFTLGNGGIGIYNFSSGTFTDGGKEIIGGSGIATFTHGTGINTQTGTGLYLGYTTGGNGTYILNGNGIVNVTTSEYIGYGATGSFTQSAANSTNTINGTLANGLYLGYNAGATGSYLLSAGSLAVASNEDIGVTGTGAFTQSGGSNTMLSFYLGVNGPGAATITANGSYTLNGGTLTETGGSGFSYEMIGYYGNGTFTQHGGSNLLGSAANPTNLYIGYFDGSTGNYIMDAAVGTPALKISGSEYIGTSANSGLGGALGTLDQIAGIHTIGGNLFIGYGAGASGSFTLTGTGQLAVGGSEYVGYAGAGTLEQQGGSNIVGGPSPGGASGDGVVIAGLYIATNSGSSGSYTLNGGTLSTPFIVNNGSFTQPAGLGTLEISGNFSNDGSATLGGSQQWSPGSVFTNTAGTAVFLSDAGSAGSFLLTINDTGGSVMFGSTQHLAGLTIAAGVTATVTSVSAPLNPSVLNTVSLRFGSGTGKLNLTDNELVTSDTIADLEAKIVAGQIYTSSTGGAIGYLDLGGGQVEARFTLLGDTNLDGTVNVSDLGNMASNFGTTSGASWVQGDTNYDGNVNVADLGNLASNFGSTLGGGVPTALESAEGVPEPAAGGLLTGALCAAVFRRRRRTSARQGGDVRSVRAG